MDDREGENKGSMQVKDRRRFDSEGNERTESSEPPKQDVPKSQPSKPAESFVMSDADENEAVSFTSFIMSLATQTLVQLGEMQAPQGMEIPADRDAAQQTIDLLSMLRKKTKGNLSEAEDKLFEDIIHSLRISYVRGAGK